MKPSIYDEVLAKDSVVEDRDQVKVVFAGGNVFHLYVEGMGEEHENVRGATKAWERAEAIRLDLNPGYTPPAPPAETPPGVSANAGNGGDVAPRATAAKAEPAKATAKAAAAEPDVVRKVHYGDVVGVSRMVPVDVVLDMLAEQAGRVALLQGSDEARRLARRVGASDGRCAPIFFTKVDMDDPHEAPAFYDGMYTLAVARNLDMEKVCVVILPSGRVGEVQGMVSSLMRANLSSVADAEADEMMYRANSD